MAQVDQTIDEALRLEDLNLPARPRVLRIFWQPYVDWQGEDSLKVWVILDDATDDSELTGEWSQILKSGIHDRLRERGITQFAYISVARESEYRELFEDD